MDTASLLDLDLLWLPPFSLVSTPRFHPWHVPPTGDQNAKEVIMKAFDDFTLENGATRIIPGSHNWDSTRRPSQDASTIPAVCPAGSVV